MKRPAALLILAFPFFGSCAWLKTLRTPEKLPEKPAPAVQKIVGRIASTPADQRFVLIQSYGSWEVAAGTVLTTRGPEKRTANLLATGETLGQFAAADIQSGTVAEGDAVYLPPPVTASSPEIEGNAIAEKPLQPESQIFKDN